MECEMMGGEREVDNNMLRQYLYQQTFKSFKNGWKTSGKLKRVRLWPTIFTLFN